VPNAKTSKSIVTWLQVSGGILPPRVSSWLRGQYEFKNWLAVLPEAMRFGYRVKIQQELSGKFGVWIWKDGMSTGHDGSDLSSHGLSSLPAAKVVAEAAIAQLLRRERPEGPYR